jgi:hypothetical protein
MQKPFFVYLYNGALKIICFGCCLFAIPITSRNEITVEFLSHGTGSPWLSSMPKGNWKDSQGAINVYLDKFELNICVDFT